MSKKKIIIIIAVLLLAAMFPWPLPYSDSLDVAKLDSQGNQIGTSTIKLHGFKSHSLLFGKRLYTLTIDGLDPLLPSFKFDTTQATTSLLGNFRYYSFSRVNMNTGGNLEEAFKTGSYSFSEVDCTVHFSPDYERWLFQLICNGEDRVYYVGSFSENLSQTEYFSYFDVDISRS